MVSLYLTAFNFMHTGLSRLTTDEKLRQAFEGYGQLVEGILIIYRILYTLLITVPSLLMIIWQFFFFAAKVITDRISGRSKGLVLSRMQPSKRQRRREQG